MKNQGEPKQYIWENNKRVKEYWQKKQVQKMKENVFSSLQMAEMNINNNNTMLVLHINKILNKHFVYKLQLNTIILYLESDL